MADTSASAPCVVVGIDGSRSALDAALWGVDEAVSRDIPLRQLYAIDPDDSHDTEEAARDLARAEIAVRYAFTAVEATEKPVKIEVEILQTRPVDALIRASSYAALLCLGDTGIHGRSGTRLGSTAAAVATSARCPVAIIRGFDPQPAEKRWVVVELDEQVPDAAVLRQASDEALLRRSPLRVLPAGPTRGSARGDQPADALERHLAECHQRYPELDIETVVVGTSPSRYLAEYADWIQLLVVSRERTHGIADLFNSPGYPQLPEACCSVLIYQPQTVL